MTPPPFIHRADESNYEMSDHSDNSDDDDDADRPPKAIPAWAQPSTLSRALMQQQQMRVDPDSIFAPIDPSKCNLEHIFRNLTNAHSNSKKKQTQRWKVRSSSGNWGNDRLREWEELEYKRRMGYIKD
jgi:hypothetical protein